MDLKRIQEDNLTLEDQLQMKSEEDYYNMVLYIGASKMSAFDKEHLKRRLLVDILKAQKRGEGPRDIFGDDLKAYCDQQMALYPTEDKRKGTLLFFLRLFFSTLSVLVLLETLFSFLRGEPTVRLSVFTLLLILLISLGIIFFFRRTMKEIFKESFLSTILFILFLVLFVTLYTLGMTESIAEPVSIRVSLLEGGLIGLLALVIFKLLIRSRKKA